MRYYPDENIDICDIKQKMNDCSCSERVDKILLTHYGMFKYINDALVVSKFNLMEEGNMSIKKYVKNVDFMITPNKWGKTDERYQLPFVNKIIQLKTRSFSPRKGSKFKFIVEETLDGIVDYYFKSPESYDNHSLKEDIGSFLDKLM
jgi:hypothetical protein|tara:strand:- start:78 stop:518 length:441 start_codon:yes stop_codon:yes gene_type:complete